MLTEPGFGFSFRDDGEDLDFFFGDVIEDSDIVDAEAKLWLGEATKAFDSTFWTTMAAASSIGSGSDQRGFGSLAAEGRAVHVWGL